MTDTTCYDNTDVMYYKDRLQTFEHWPRQIIPDKFRLAKAGFYYRGETNKVTCFACGIQLKHWERTDDPLTEHNKWSPNCIYMKITGGIINKDGGFKPPVFGQATSGLNRDCL